MLTIPANQNIITTWIQMRLYKVKILLYESKYIIWKSTNQIQNFLLFWSLIDDSIFSDGFHYLHCQKLVYHRNKAATINDVANVKLCGAMDLISFGVIWNNILQFLKLSPAVDTVQIINTQTSLQFAFIFLDR